VDLKINNNVSKPTNGNQGSQIMTKNSKRDIRQPDTMLVEALLQIIEPVRALQNVNPNRINEEALDTGHEQPAMKDKTFAYLMSNIAQNAWNQLYGQLRAADGRSFQNAKEWLDTSRKKLVETEKNVADPDLDDRANFDRFITSSDWITAMHYVETNEAKCRALEELKDAAATVYKLLTLEDWAPRTNEVASSVRKVEVSTEKAEHYLKLLQQRNNRARA
jgi:hypothetical protein